MIAIGLQNIPEGLAVSICSMNAGLGKSIYASRSESESGW